MREEEANDARCEVVALAKAMVAGQLPYIEGAYQICRLRSRMEGIEHRDPDFAPFVVIESETDALPLQAQRHLWSERALTELEPEFERTQKWAASIAEEACQRLITRFSQS